MLRPLKWGILGASTIILSKDIDKYAFMHGLNFYETDVTNLCWLTKDESVKALSQILYGQNIIFWSYLGVICFRTEYQSFL